MSSSRWWIALALGAAVIGVAAWYALRVPDRGEAGAAAAQSADGEPRTHPAEEYQPRPDAPDGTADEGVERATIGETDVGASGAGARTENFVLDDVMWIEGVVELPPQAPPDDSLQVFATATGDGTRWERQFASMSPHALIEAMAEEPTPAIARRRVSADGRFRVPMRARSPGALLRLDGRFLYVNPCPTVELARASKAVRLDAKLGAWVRGRVALPAGLPAALDLSPLERAVPQIAGWGGVGGGFRRDAALDADRAFEFRGVPTDMTSWFTLDPMVLAPVRISSWKLAPGERFDAEVQLELGATLRGRVVDAAGASVGGAELHARRTGGPGFSNDIDRPGASDETGAFLLLGVAPGKTTLTASAKGFRTAQQKLDPLQNGQVLGGLAVVLERGNTVAGSVRWPDGTPAVCAKVRAFGSARGRRSREGRDRNLEGVETDANGAFEISGLDDGTFTVEAELTPLAVAAADSGAGATDVARWWARAADVPAQSRDLELVLAAPLSVRGRVLDDRGAPLAAFEVAADLDGQGAGEYRYRPLSQSFSDELGAFELTGFRPGRWKLSAASDSRRRGPEIAIDLPFTGEVTLSLPRGASLAGVVLDPAGAALEGAVVEVRGGEGSFARTETRSAQDGRFEIADAQPGHVAVAARAEGFAPSDTLEIEIPPGGDLRDLVLSLSIGGRLEGEVYEEGGAPSVDRMVMVQAVGSERREFGQQVKTDAAGRFAMEHLAPGRYQAMALPPAGALDGGDADPSDFVSKLKIARVEVRTGETAHVVLGAPPKSPVRVLGTVTRGRRRFAGAQITVVADGGSLLESMKIVRSAGDGSYALTLDAPGNYVFVVGDGLISTSSLEFHEVIPEASEVRVDLALPDASLSGVVLDADGAPVVGVHVSIEHEQSTASWLNADGLRGVESGERGEFRVERLRAGTYTLRADGGNARQGGAVLSGVRVDDEAAVEGVVIRLPRGATLRGEVRDRDGKPIAGASIFVRDAQGQVLRVATRCESDASGRFTYAGVPAGRLTASARKGAACSVESGPIDVPAGGVAEVALVLDAGTMLRIALEGAGGQTVRGHVSVVDDVGREWSGLFGRDALEGLLNEGFSSAEQRVGPLPPGRYRIRAGTVDGASASKPVTLSGQGERKVTLRLGP